MLKTHYICCGLLLLASVQSARSAADYSTPYSFTTVTGASSIGSTDGPAATARFFAPVGVAIDAVGNIFLADKDNHLVRKITPAGTVSTVAGLYGVRGEADGTGAEARFNEPTGIAVDAAGNLYVTEISHRIRRITPAGVVSTLSGSANSPGFVDGTGIAARFNIPAGIVIDAVGNLYVADSGNNTIRKITPSGVVSTLAGTAGVYGSTDGTGAVASFFYPYSIAADSAGNLIVGEVGNFTVRHITPTGVVTTLAGSASSNGFADGVGPAARFDGVMGVAVDSAGVAYVADAGHTIRRITTIGAVTTIAGSAPVTGSVDGTGPAAAFHTPCGLVIDPNGQIVVADRDNNTIRRVSPAGLVTTIAGLSPAVAEGSADGSAVAARFELPAGTAVGPNGDIYVADPVSSTVRKITTAGIVTTLAGQAGLRGSTDGVGAAARFDTPWGIAVDPNSTVFVTDHSSNTVRRIAADGTVSTLAGSAGLVGSTDGTGSVARFNDPTGISVGSDGTLYVADSGNYLVRKISPSGSVTTLAGTAGVAGTVDGTTTSALLRAPAGIAVDTSGTVFLSEALTEGGTIRKISPDGTVSTLAGGTGGDDPSTDGTGSAARFNAPWGLAVDSSGNLYVADTLNQLVRKVSPSGKVTTVAGWAFAHGSADSVGAGCRFDRPMSVAVDARGKLVVTSGSTVRRGEPAIGPTIVSQPASLTVAAGARATFTVEATGTPAPSYQWFLNGTALSGATASTYSIDNAQAAHAGEYTVTVTNPLNQITSNRAALTITPVIVPPSTDTNGGGGALPALWVLALAGLGVLRWSAVNVGRQR